jgi:hypothetical protein
VRISNPFKNKLAAFQPGAKVEVTQGYLKGERATIEVSPDAGSHIQVYGGYTEIWIRYDKDGQEVGYAILLPQWEHIDHLRVVG